MAQGKYLNLSYYHFSDECVVYQHESANLYLLPSSNVDLLLLLNDGVGLDVIVGIFVSQYGLDVAAARKYVKDCYENYNKTGLIEH